MARCSTAFWAICSALSVLTWLVAADALALRMAMM
jgi:hypothetical protein